MSIFKREIARLVSIAWANEINFQKSEKKKQPFQIRKLGVLVLIQRKERSPDPNTDD